MPTAARKPSPEIEQIEAAAEDLLAGCELALLDHETHGHLTQRTVQALRDALAKVATKAAA